MTELDKIECVRLTLESAYLRGADLSDESDRELIAGQVLDDLAFLATSGAWTHPQRLSILREVVAEDRERWRGNPPSPPLRFAQQA